MTVLDTTQDELLPLVDQSSILFSGIQWPSYEMADMEAANRLWGAFWDSPVVERQRSVLRRAARHIRLFVEADEAPTRTRGRRHPPDANRPGHPARRHKRGKKKSHHYHGPRDFDNPYSGGTKKKKKRKKKRKSSGGGHFK